MSPLPFDPIRPDRLVTDLPIRGQGDLLSAAVPRIPTAKENERLLALGLYYNEPEPAVLCIRCGFALKTGTDRVSRHLGEKHGITRKARRGLNRLVRSLQLPEPAQLARRPDGSAKHPHLVLQKGASCKHCSFRSASLVLLSHHLKRSHRHVINANPRGRWLRSHVNEGLLFQGWLANDIQSAWVVVTDHSQQMSLDTADGDDDPISRALQRHVEEICAQERQHIASKAGPAGQIDLAPEHAVMMTNWMRRTGWEDTFRGACRGALVSLAELPVPHLGPLRLTTQDGTVMESSEADEKRLAVMVTAVDRLFNRCGDTVRSTDVSIRRWLRGMHPDRPFKAPFELVAQARSERQYRRLVKRCICFWVRMWRLSRSMRKSLMGRTLYAAQDRALEALWCDPVWDECSPEPHDSMDAASATCSESDSHEEEEEESWYPEVSDEESIEVGGSLSDDGRAVSDRPGVQQDPHADTILRFCYHMATEDFEDGRASSTLLIYFSAVCGLSVPDGAEFLRPGQYTTHLAGLIYCVRLIMLESVLPCVSHDYIGIKARPRRRQLDVLQPLRRDKMCDGSVSPLGEMFSLLAFGNALRKSDGPTFHFEWSDDGEEVSWDGECHLTMDAFRGLVRTAPREKMHMLLGPNVAAVPLDEEESDGPPEPHDSMDAASATCSESDSHEEEEEESWYPEVSDEESIEVGGSLSDDGRAVSDRPGVQQDPHADTILRFCYHMATEDFEDGRASSTLLIYFSAVCGLSVPDGAEFLRPGQYTTHLAGLIYCMRLIMLESVLPCVSHDYIGIKARPRRRQLDVLQPLRRDKMCDGSVSPLGEMFSLLAFGNALRKSDGPTFHFEWSDDGEEVSWDGECRLTMDAFRGLVRTVLEAASQTMQRLMYGLEPPRPDFRRIRDRLSSSSVGYSFVTDPANGLACDYLKLLTRACLSPIDGLLRRDARGESSWDLKAVTRYIEGHDELLKMLMLLFHLGGGQGSRITELLTVEHCNTASRLRGIGIFAGQMFSITRHHKARLTTNKEFQVARFLPEPIAAIAYNYLVFIRGATYMLRRTCLNQGQDETVLFTPAAKRTAWRTDVLSRELRHFSRISPGVSFDIGARLYRQLSIAITERHVRAAAGYFNRHDDTSPHGDPDAAFAWQSGHRPRQRHSTYGLDGAYPDQLQPALLQLYLRVSKKWHAFLRLEEELDQRDNSHCSDQHGVASGMKQPNPLKRPLADESSSEVDTMPSKRSRRNSLRGDDSGSYIDEEPANNLSVETGMREASPRSTPPTVETSHAYGPFVYVSELRLAVCRLCKHAVLADEVKTHLRNEKHRLTLSLQHRSNIASEIQQIPGILKRQEDLINFELPRPDSPVLPYIAPPKEDGLRCDTCGYGGKREAEVPEKARPAMDERSALPKAISVSIRESVVRTVRRLACEI
ncbi:hypothetical protein HIM_09522 [Hirsutella minnesotensis 3608]|uniref:Uncharacterized protein n=1 Tax=Hirsutella minnesotensis 3608 TaxID=1043627 RepID=A0A0F7ZSC1_9HYPO|nr:hypothetical protein HIM_09522 [Hirsutella minnesotensis 3608]